MGAVAVGLEEQNTFLQSAVVVRSHLILILEKCFEWRKKKVVALSAIATANS